ncbi:hypothetical protein SDRG_13112 [Saprolegnia diclina VS20]|uniref:Uncharacterized protein n=1 Tax=Saprolegnia diclina (strain VS20) TaxID=1156394 RepID=T0PUN8_SAPDV|nr:hypothetical protein SDRG_13112 [Saprolegnia diclina VS20]EQC29239.1 hypothetical protein SDRG_13112 [Saprolegnia diclina VS20]|eukprot:XP_008617417.1 hypothetical protein SDRG_13112 [Saprolegnia diclina VS20]
MVTSPSRPLGVSLRYFHHLIEACGGRKKLNGLTTAQVCFDYIVPLTKSTELSLVDHLASDASMRHFVSEANWYVSHAWQYLFLETVDSLDTFFTDQGLADDAVLWFCVFNNNQHLAHSYPFEYWSSTFKTQLAAIGNVVMIMHPWNDPVVLRRSWCVFEVYVAVTMKARFEMAMAPGQLGLLVHDMLRPAALEDMLGTIKSEASETTVPSDRDGIFELIRAETSFTAVDRLIFSTISDWMERTLTAQIASGLLPLDEAYRYLCLATIHGTRSSSADVFIAASRARTLFASLDIQVTDNIHLVRVMTYLGRSSHQVGEPETTWRTIFNDLLAIDGLDAMTLCHVRNAYAHALNGVKYFVEARALSLETYAMALTDLGAVHKSTIATMSTLGLSSYKLFDYDQAIDWFRKCLEAQLSLLGSDHPSTVYTRDYLAMICFKRGQLVEAKTLFEETSDVQERMYGPLHNSTMVASFNLGLTYRFLGDYAAAEALWLPIWDRFQKSPPAPGQYIHLLFLLAQLYWSKGDYDLGKQYMLDTLAWCLTHLPPGDADTSQGASAFYRFLLDPTFAAHNPASDEAWAKIVAFFAKNELETEVWLDETCFGCSQPMQGLWFECSTCPAFAYHFCANCLRQGKSTTFCDHATCSFKCYVPPRRYLLEQALVASVTDQATATLWRDYQTYCTANKVPGDEQAAFASYEPIATRTWHPML